MAALLHMDINLKEENFDRALEVLASRVYGSIKFQNNVRSEYKNGGNEES